MRRILALLALLPTIYSILHTITPVALAASYQQCETSSTCTVGEFLYDDNYAALPGQSCTFTAKYPDGTNLVSSAAMTSRSDGYYSYAVTTGTTTGLYSATICCVPSSGTMCLDKSFEVKAPATSGSTLTAADVWSYGNRTLTSYGTLVSDIWSYTSRSLTSFGSLVSDIWGYSSRTMSSFGSLVSSIWGYEDRDLTSSTPDSSGLQAIVAEQKNQREILEKLVNAPIITLEIGDNERADLNQKIQDSKTAATNIYDAIQSTRSRLLSLESKWPRLNPTARENELTALSSLWSSNEDIAKLETLWNTEAIANLSKSSQTLKDAITLALSGTTNKISPVALTTSLEPLTELETQLGDISSTSTEPTIFGYLTQVAEKDSLLTSENQKLVSLLDDWDSTGESMIKRQLEESQKRVLALTTFPHANQVLTSTNKVASGKDQLKNLLLNLQGLIGLSRATLASRAGDPVRALWLEEGSIIFRAVITNPSHTISQDAQVRFTLPAETKSEDIVSIDPNLKANYDPSANALAVTGNFNISPDSTVLAAVELKDIWTLDTNELTKLSQKANELTDTLKKGNLHAQGLALSSEIDSTITSISSSAHTQNKPENRIRAYREAKLKLASVESNMTQLENLVALDSSNRTLVGFVGGVNTIAVLGIILVVVAGFVFLSRYFARLTPNFAGSSTDLPLPLASPAPTLVSSAQNLAPAEPWSLPKPAFTIAVVAITSLVTVTLTRLSNHSTSTPPAVNQVVTPVASTLPSPTPITTPQPNSVNAPSPSIIPPAGSSVNIRNNPSSSADVVMTLHEPTPIIIFKTQGEWTQIGFGSDDQTRGYWVSSQFVANE